MNDKIIFFNLYSITNCSGRLMLVQNITMFHDANTTSQGEAIAHFAVFLFKEPKIIMQIWNNLHFGIHQYLNLIHATYQAHA